jgi:hypothetical protein
MARRLLSDAGMRILNALLLVWLFTPSMAFAQATNADARAQANVNERYTVETVDVSGIDEASISQELRDALQGLTGRRLDPVEAVRLSRRLQHEFRDYHVEHRIERGSAEGRIRVVFQFTRTEDRYWLRFTPGRSKLIYHEDQGWSGALTLGAGSRSSLFSVGFARGDNDELIEEYSGYWFRFENRRAGTRRLGLSFEFSKLSQDWRTETLDALTALPDVPAPYGERRTVEPMMKVALTPQISLAAGASFVELEALTGGGSERANAGVVSLAYDRTWKPEFGAAQRLQGGYEYRFGTDALDSDLEYRRHAAHARYRYEEGRSTVIAELRVGRLSGRPPLFERFALGDSTTLRGWNKYDLAPAGGDRMVHQSVEYRYRHFAYFFDAGSVWNAGEDARVRLATGVGLHGDNFFVTLGFPLNADKVRATWILGVRF